MFSCLRVAFCCWLNAHNVTANKFSDCKLCTECTVIQRILSQKTLRMLSVHNLTRVLPPRPGIHTLRFGGCRPKWPLRFYETHLPTLPYILLRVINYAGKLLALRGKIAATIWRQPQFLPNPSHICSPAVAFWIHCNAYKVSILAF